jgi:hypothetical protein
MALAQPAGGQGGVALEGGPLHPGRARRSWYKSLMILADGRLFSYYVGLFEGPGAVRIVEIRSGATTITRGSS